MKFLKFFLIVIAIVAIIWIALAQYGTITLDARVTGYVWLNGADTMIAPAGLIDIRILATSSGGTSPRLHWSSPFKLSWTGPFTLIWGDTALFVQPQFGSFWDVSSSIYTESLDGISPELIAFQGVASEVGYPGDLGWIELFHFTLNRTAVSCLDTGTICIEQGDPVNEQYDWLFDVPVPTFTKKCWEILDPPCARPRIHGCSSEIIAPPDIQATHQFSVSDAGSPSVKYYILSGPGNIDSLTGLWSYTASSDDEWQSFDLGVIVTDQTCMGLLCTGWRNYCLNTVYVRPFCGDVNIDNAVDLLDILYLIDYKFHGGTAPDSRMADVNSDGNIDLLDILDLIGYKFKNGQALNCP